jgi:transcription antitermination factor NusG
MTSMQQEQQADWYIFGARPRREGQASEQLAKRGIAAMAPRTRTFERLSRKRVVACDQPVYRGYVFASPGDQWGRLREVPTLNPKPLGMGDKPYRMRHQQVDEVAELVRNPPPDPRDPYPYGKADPNAPPFAPGARVVIASGPFAPFLGKVEVMKIVAKRWVARVDVMIFGRPTPVDIDAGSLVPA